MSLDVKGIIEHARALGTLDPLVVRVVKQCWCGSPVVGRGLCSMHYQRAWRIGFGS